MDWNGWNGMKWDRLEWTGLEWNEWLEWNGIEWNGMERNGMERREWMEWKNGMDWNGPEGTGMEWKNGMDWNGLEWTGMNDWGGLDWTGLEWLNESRIAGTFYQISQCWSHLPKVLAARHFFNILKWTSSSCYSPARFFNNFHRSMPATAETETLLRRRQEPLYPKNTGFRARECFHPWIHMLPTSELLHVPSSWHDDVVDMMRREHDDKTAPGHSAVTRKFSNQTSIDKYVIKWSFVEKIRVTESERSH